MLYIKYDAIWLPVESVVADLASLAPMLPVFVICDSGAPQNAFCSCAGVSTALPVVLSVGVPAITAVGGGIASDPDTVPSAYVTP